MGMSSRNFNWTVWKPYAICMLFGRQLWDCVKEAVNKPVYNEIKWKNKDNGIIKCSRINTNNASASSLIWGMVSSNLLSCITVDIDHPYHMQKALEKQAFSSASICSIIMIAHFSNATTNKNKSITLFFALLIRMYNIFITGSKTFLIITVVAYFSTNACLFLTHLRNAFTYLRIYC
jgi:hypothetical protein